MLAESDDDAELYPSDLAALRQSPGRIGTADRGDVVPPRSVDLSLAPAEHGVSEQIDDFQMLLRVAHEQLREVFREHGEVDFTEITGAATEALGGPEQPTDLLYALDYKIEHLLVDEFQDTSRSQYELLSALTGQWSDGDGHTLFLVGDPMQSIYGFRQRKCRFSSSVAGTSGSGRCA